MSLIAQGPGHGSINGVPFASTSVRISTTGRAKQKITDLGVFLVPTVGATSASVDAPFIANGDPIDVADLAARLLDVSALFVFAFDNGSTYSMWVLLDEDELTSSATDGADISYKFLATTKIRA